MSSAVASSPFPAASGGNDWLFSDPYAYQYSDIPEHERGVISRSQSPAISTTGSAASDLESSLPKKYTLSDANNEHFFELEGSEPQLPPAPRPRFSYTVPPSPEKGNVAELSSVNYVPTLLVPGQGHAQSQPQSQPHVLNFVNRSEIVRSRHANVRLSRKYPSTHSHHHKRMITAPEPVPVAGMRNEHLAGRTGSPLQPPTSGLIPVEPSPRRLIPIKTDVRIGQSLMPVDENSSAVTPKKDFDSILRDIEPVSKKKNSWRNSRSLAYQAKYETWGA